MAARRTSPGTENVLVDLGFADAEDLSAKARLAMKINALIAARKLSQAAAARLLALPQPKISAIHNYKLRGISLERLMHALVALDQRVEIVVRRAARHGEVGIRVAA